MDKEITQTGSNPKTDHAEAPSLLPAVTEAPKTPRKGAKIKAAAKRNKEGTTALKQTVHEACKGSPGQPTKFSDEKWDVILEAVATYRDLFEVCSKPDMPSVQTIYRWIRENPALKDDMRGAWEMFSYIGHSVNQNIIRGGVLSTGDFRRDEAAVTDNRWFMGKTNRRDFGDKVQHEVSVANVFVMEQGIIDMDED